MRELKSRHAYLIMAHHQMQLLKILCHLLDHPNHDIFIHVDAKTKEFDVKEFDNITQYSSIFFTERLNITWGGYQMVECELMLLKAACNKDNYSYYHLLSGSDLPLRTAKDIYDFFERNSGKEFIHFCNDGNYQRVCIKERAKYFHFFQEYIGRKKNIFWLCEKISVLIQKCLGIDRNKANKEAIHHGAQWFSITGDFAQYIIKNESWIEYVFKNTIVPDESFLQTLVMKSHFRTNLYMLDPQGDYHSNMRFIDWNRGTPYTFCTKDFDELISSDYMFARKFDLNVDSNICEKMEQYLSDKT